MLFLDGICEDGSGQNAAGAPGIEELNRVSNALYRSADYRAGEARKVGSLHLHVDVPADGQSEIQLERICRQLDTAGFPSKVTRVHAALAGLHFEDSSYSADYAIHTP